MAEFNTTVQQDITEHVFMWEQTALVTLSPTSYSAMLSRSYFCPAVQELCKAFDNMTISQFQVIRLVPIEVPTEARSCGIIYLRYS